VLPGRRFTPDEIVRILLRRGWLIVLPFAIGLSSIPLVAKKVPRLYRSETLMVVIPQRVPDMYVRSTVTGKVQERLPSISNQILSRSRLERTINDFNLYKDLRVDGIMEDIVLKMRRDISVDLEAEDSFRVSYVSTDPKTAQQVTARLASLYIEENLRDRENLAEETNLFLESQLNDAKERLIEHEKKLEAYRREHAGELPSQLDMNLRAIQNAQTLLQGVTEAINRARERRLFMERQIADADLMAAAIPIAQPIIVAPAGPDAPVSTARQLEILEAQLSLQKMRYTADHPDIRNLERTIRDLRAKLLEEEQNPPEPRTEEPPSPAELARQKRVRDLQAELAVIDHQLAAHEAEEARLKKTMTEYQAKIEVLPSRESDLVELTRDYGTLQAAYASLLTKREESKIAANLERRQIGEQFRIIDPASLPERPFNQAQRLGVIASGAIAGLALGLLLVGVLEFRDSSLRNEEDVLRTLALPVLALVPFMASDRQRRARRRRTVVVNFTAAMALLGSMAVIVLWRMRG
jgi:polysaccharide chain length determinant protein (PEP-CTERM system associated)